jgi:hypothetical protein
MEIVTRGCSGLLYLNLSHCYVTDTTIRTLARYIPPPSVSIPFQPPPHSIPFQSLWQPQPPESSGVSSFHFTGTSLHPAREGVSSSCVP